VAAIFSAVCVNALPVAPSGADIIGEHAVSVSTGSRYVSEGILMRALPLSALPPGGGSNAYLLMRLRGCRLVTLRSCARLASAGDLFAASVVLSARPRYCGEARRRAPSRSTDGTKLIFENWTGRIAISHRYRPGGCFRAQRLNWISARVALCNGDMKCHRAGNLPSRQSRSSAAPPFLRPGF
jgi:hypothetical protein